MCKMEGADVYDGKEGATKSGIGFGAKILKVMQCKNSYNICLEA